MSTFEGPLLSIKSINSLAHYTDWIIGHVHAGALGWNGFLTFSVIYYLVPKLWNTKLYSIRLANAHFWLGLFGILLYYTSMITAGITEGLMWRALDPQGHLMYPDFIETVVRVIPLYWARAFGGTIFIVGFVLMLINIYKTISLAPQTVESPVLKAAPRSSLVEVGVAPHRRLEGMTAIFSVLSLVAVLVGTALELYPTLFLHKYLPDNGNQRPYSALELAGRDIYTREGCYLCHSQQIRPLAAEVLRYGPASTPEESMYDHPFQWGSKRIGPDLSREGRKYPDLWHLRHMIDPRAITAQSIMPQYTWLAQDNLDFMILRKKFSVMRKLGVPYSDQEVAEADIRAEKQAQEIALALEKEGAPKGLEKKEIVALIAYLQSLGQKTKGVQP